MNGDRQLDEYEIGEYVSRVAKMTLRRPEELLYDAWTVIANVSEGDWEKQTPEWKAAAERWRDNWHSYLDGRA